MINLHLAETGIDQARKRYRLMSESFVAAPRPVAKSAAKLILAALRRNAPKQTHRLELDLRFEMVPLGTGFIARFYGPFYTQWVIEGRGEVWAGIYTGRSNKRFLHFWIDGKEIFTKHVKAARPNDFRRPALAESRPGIEGIMHEAGVRTIRGAGVL